MGILRTDKISGLETPTAVTGSVSFDGDGDFLTLVDSGDWDHKQKFTWETWIYLNSYDTSGALIVEQRSNGGSTGVQWYINTSNEIVFNQNGSTNLVTAPNTFTIGVWHHLAVCHDGSTIRMFMDGVLANSASTSTVPDNVSEPLRIGRVDGYTTYDLNGYLSNLRFVNGTALYTANFTPPTHELEKIGDTVLLCCNNPDSAGAEATGKAITVNGNAAASTVSPGLTRDFTFGTQFEGVSRFDTQGYFVPPSGTTAQQFPDFAGVSAASARGLFGGSYTYGPSSRPSSNVIDYITISSTGNAIDFGDLTLARGTGGSCASPVRGVFAGGNTGAPTSPGANNTIDYVTIASTGNAQDFGDLTAAREHGVGSCSSSTRGLFGGGTSPAISNAIDYVTISSTGNATDFGDLTVARYGVASFSSQVRGIFAGSDLGPAYTNVIDFITIASTGNAIDFGDLTNKTTTSGLGGLSNSTRGLIAGGSGPGTNENIIEYITISTLGNSVTFGNLTTNDERRFPGGAASSIRGVFAGGYGGGPTYTTTNVIDYVTISTQSDAVDFGDLTTTRATNGGLSNGHGGLS